MNLGMFQPAMLVYQRVYICLNRQPGPFMKFQRVHRAFDKAVDEDPLFPQRFLDGLLGLVRHPTQIPTNVYIHIYVAGNMNFI